MILKAKYLSIVFLISIYCNLYAQENNYQYDAQGRVIADHAEGILNIVYDNASRVIGVTKADTCTSPDVVIAYDERGNRMSKLVKPRNGRSVEPEFRWKGNFYEYDASGSITAIYERTYSQIDENLFEEIWTVKEYPIYSETRIGLSEWDTPIAVRTLNADINSEGKFTNKQYIEAFIPNPTAEGEMNVRGIKKYQFENHLDNVLLVSSDRLITSNVGEQAINKQSEVVLAMDYYPYGMTMPNRKTQNGAYRFGFGGKEKDNEIMGEENSYDFVGRSIYDPRLARFTSIDPLWRKFASASPYAYGANNPIVMIDNDGRDPIDFRFKKWLWWDSNNYERFVAGILDEGIESGNGLIEIYHMVTGTQHGAKLLKNMGGMIWTLAMDEAAFDSWYKDFMNGIGKDMKNLDGDGDEVWYTRGRYAFYALSAGVGVALGATAKGAQGAHAASGVANKVKKVKTAKPEGRAPTAASVVAHAACFLGDTEVLTYGGKLVYIKDISVEKEYYKLTEEEEERLKNEEKDMVELEVEGITYLVAYNHFFFVDNNWKMAKDLEVGDEMLRLDGTTVIVTAIKVIPVKELKKVTSSSPLDKDSSRDKTH